MSNFVIALLIAIGASVWIYYRFFSHQTGSGNLKPAIIGSVVTGVILFIVAFSLLSIIMKK